VILSREMLRAVIEDREREIAKDLRARRLSHPDRQPVRWHYRGPEGPAARNHGG
jgi:hypothetical protein